VNEVHVNETQVNDTAADPLSYQQFCQLSAGTPLAALQDLASLEFLHSLRHGSLPAWLELLARTPQPTPVSIDLLNKVRIGERGDCSDQQHALIRENLQALIPWRKGPFELFGIDIDTEWRSDMKWDRLREHISPLTGRSVLDVGCGSAYHCFRMLGAEARLVIGIEPHLPYVMQFALLKRFVPQLPLFVLPVTMERLPAGLAAFDTVFSMGVLYHRRSPIDHLLELKACLRKGGELVLETLVVDGPEGYSLFPEGRYSNMGNVWFIPSCATAESWLHRCGFNNIRIVDISVTTSAEQRRTEWMPFQSLEDSLDAADRSTTIEGLPAPKRAIFIASVK